MRLFWVSYWTLDSKLNSKIFWYVVDLYPSFSSVLITLSSLFYLSNSIYLPIYISVCNLCIFSHLAFIIQYAKTYKKATHRELSESLNSYHILTQRSKKWHSSLNGLLNRRPHYNGSIQLSQTNVGEFSRYWYPLGTFSPLPLTFYSIYLYIVSYSLFLYPIL